MLGEVWKNVGRGMGKYLGGQGKCWERCEKVCWGVKRDRGGGVWISVGGGEKSILRCGKVLRRCEEVLEKVLECVLGDVGKC